MKKAKSLFTVPNLIRCLAVEFAIIALLSGLTTTISAARELSFDEQAKSFKTELPFLVMNSTGCSMLPAYSEDELLLVSTTRIPKKGDVIVFSANRQLIDHRVLSFDKSSGRIDTKGDNNDEPDGFDTTLADTLGVVVAHVPHMGHIVNLNAKVAAMMSLVCMAETILLFILAHRCAQNQREREQQAAREQLAAIAQAAMAARQS